MKLLGQIGIVAIALWATACIGVVEDDESQGAFRPAEADATGDVVVVGGAVSESERTSPQCSVTPSPVGLGRPLRASAAGFATGETVRVAVLQPDGDEETLVAIASDSGVVIAEATAGSLGRGVVAFYRIVEDREQLRTTCSFEVIDDAVCSPRTCDDVGAACGSMSDGCGGTLECGRCPAGQSCAAGQCQNEPCRPRSCADVGAACGSVSDGCGGTLSCGGCPRGETCGGGGMANQCGRACQPTSCAQAGATCGLVSDGCGGTLSCGGCTSPETCGGAGVANQCGAMACQPRGCVDLGASCGAASDGCGGTLDCGGCSGAATCVSNQCESGAWPAGLASMEAEVLRLINAERAAGATCGSASYGPAPPLEMETNLRLAARLHSLDMADQNYFSHASLDGRNFTQRMGEAGWSGSCPCGENIAAGQRTATAVVDGWMDSPGHCRNIMNSSFGAVGIGAAEGGRFGIYWTQNFAAR